MWVTYTYKGGNLQKTMNFIFAAFLCLSLDFLLPAHYHSDLKEDADCAICFAQSQPTEAAFSFNIDLFIVFILTTVFFLPTPVFQEIIHYFQSRAPPINAAI